MEVKKNILTFVITLVLSQSLFAAENKAIDILIQKTIKPSPLLDDLRYLSDTIGGRTTGSQGMNAALKWGLQTFKKAGISNARLQAYTPPRNWLPNIEQGNFSVANHTQLFPLRLASMPFTVSTPAQGIQASVFVVDSENNAEINKFAKDIKGKWLLVKTKSMQNFDDLFAEYLKTPSIFAAAKEVGAVGVLWLADRPGKLLYRHNATLNGTLAGLPGAVIEKEGGEQIIREVKAGIDVKVNAKLINTIQEKPLDYNIVAEVVGTEKPNEVIILGAHLDSWDLGKGVLDDGCNVALVLDVARQMQALQSLGYKPRRTIRFMLYSGEEFGLFGSWYDVKNRKSELDTIKAVVIYDLGSGRTTGFSLGGRKDLVNVIDHALQPVNSLGPFVQTTDAFVDTDNFDYLLHGIPTFVANQDSAPYLSSYHAESDTLDKNDNRELKLNTTIAAVLTWNLANTQDDLPRQDAKAVNSLLKTTGLKKQMETFQLWDSYINQQR